MRLSFAPARRFTMQERRQLAEARLAAGMLDRDSIAALAWMRRDLCDYDGAIALIAPDAGGDADLAYLFGDCAMSIGTAAILSAAEAVLLKAQASEGDGVKRARLLGVGARIAAKQGDIARALDLLNQADVLAADDPARLLFHGKLIAQTHGAEALLDWVAAKPGIGPGATARTALHIEALAAAGRAAEARSLQELERDLHRSTLGDAGLGQALADELAAHPGCSIEAHAHASRETLRIDEPLLQRSQHVAAFEPLLADAIRAHAARATGDHPFAANRPAAASVRYWALLNEGAGHQLPHIHPKGWMSGVYYPSVPGAIASGADDAGCLLFSLTAEADAMAVATVRPQSGLVVTFPSFAYHRTRPFVPQPDEPARVCIAFDVMPDFSA